MHMVVRIGVIQGKSRLVKRLELCTDLRFELFPDVGKKEESEARTPQMRRKRPIGFQQIRYISRRRDRMSLDKRQMEPYLERGMLPGSLYCVPEKLLSHHEARGRENSLIMTFNDGLIDGQCETEIISSNYDSLQFTFRIAAEWILLFNSSLAIRHLRSSFELLGARLW